MKTLAPRVAILFALLLAIGLTAGRAEEKKDDKPEKPAPVAVGTVSGTVTLAGKPLPAGWITFHGPDGTGSVRANIDGGKYATPGVFAGRQYRITINVESIRARAETLREELARLEGRAQLLKGAKAEDAVTDRRIKELKERVKVVQEMVKRLKGIKVPPKFTTRETTPLTREVTKGAQTMDLQLEE